MGPKQTSKLAKQDIVFLSSPSLNGSTAVFPRKPLDIKDEGLACPLIVDAPLDSKAGAVWSPIISFGLFDGQLCRRPKAFDSASTEWRSGGGGGFAVMAGDYLDTTALAGADALCMLKLDIEFVGRILMDASK